MKKYVIEGRKWFDKVNGNTYHSVRITRCSDGKQLVEPMQYGYGDDYCQTALAAMDKAGWLPKKYKGKESYLFERENNYPINWNVSDGLKRDCVSNGQV